MNVSVSHLVCIDGSCEGSQYLLMSVVCMQPAQKLSGDTLLKNLHPDLRLYIIKEFSIPRPLGFYFVMFDFSLHILDKI